LFYSARTTTNVPDAKASRRKRNNKPSSRHAAIIDSLKALGLSVVNDAQVEDALKAVFPNGIDGVDQGELIRASFIFVP